MKLAAFVFARTRPGLRGLLYGALCLGMTNVPGVQADGPVRAMWFPDQPETPHFAWTFRPCDGCQTVQPRAEWLAMEKLAGLPEVRFLTTPEEANGPAYSYAPNTIVLAPSALRLAPCQLSFLVGHEMVHIAQRHFDEDAIALSLLSGKPAGWTRDGQEAISLLDDNFPLALRMSVFWQEQEREADWVGALLAAQACGCSLEDGALSYLRANPGDGGGVAATHEGSAERARFLQAFAESARRLVKRSY